MTNHLLGELSVVLLLLLVEADVLQQQQLQGSTKQRDEWRAQAVSAAGAGAAMHPSESIAVVL